MLKDDRSGAVLSDDREYRYKLTRMWDESKPTCAFLMLNPSTADETENDPTIRRCLGYAKEWGYGRLVVGNLFALRATNPDELRDHPDPVGPANDEHLEEIVDGADLVVAAWGTDGALQDRGREVAERFPGVLHALTVTKNGHPGHPLYLSSDLDPTPYHYPGGGPV